MPLGKHDNVTTFYLVSRYNKFDLFIPKPEIDYNGSMENTIVAEVAIISDDDDDIDELNKKNRTESNLVIIHETSMQPRYSRKY